MIEGVGAPQTFELHVLCTLLDGEYCASLGALCTVNIGYARTSMGPVKCEDIVAHVGPLPDPVSILCRKGN